VVISSSNTREKKRILADRDVSFLWYENEQPQKKSLGTDRKFFFREGLPIVIDGDSDLDIYASRTVREQIF
jgi:hypothetical protein